MSEAVWKEPCKICALDGVDFRFTVSRNVLTGHIGKKHQGWSKKRYLERWPDSGPHFKAYILPPEELQKRRNELAERPLVTRHRDGIIESLKQLNQPDYNMLEEDEKLFYDQWVEHAIQQTDRDESQMPMIQSTAFSMIYVKRLRSRQLASTSRRKLDEPIAFDKDFETTVRQKEEQIAKAMDKLGLSREAQLKQGALIKSTASSIISGYLLEIERMTPEMLDALALDEKRVHARSFERLEKSNFCDAPDMEQEEEEHDTGKPLSRDAALARAGLAEGGVEKTPVIVVSGDGDLPF